METVEYISNEVASTVHYHSLGGEWWELYNEDDAANCYYKHTLFWRGAGYMKEHSHAHIDERIEVLYGEAVYYIEGRRYHAKAGDVIFIPAGKRHINPFNCGKGYLILIHEKPHDKLIAFFKYYYKQVEMEKYLFNRHSLPTHKQLTHLNKLFPEAIHFQCKGLVPRLLKQLGFYFEAIW
jgi:mannose-6-phosphate isomerase-like protein (cupin superfamily)